jgi:hypothetical protein
LKKGEIGHGNLTRNNKILHGKTKNFKKQKKIYNLWTITITTDSTNQDIHMQKNMNVNSKCSNEMKRMDPYRSQIWLLMK